MSNVPSYSVLYGSIGAVIILMIWLYLGSMIIVLGSELNAVLAERFARVDRVVRGFAKRRRDTSERA